MNQVFNNNQKVIEMTNFFSVISVAGLFLAATNLIFSSTTEKLARIYEMASGAM